MTDDDREWLRKGVQRAGEVETETGMGYYFLAGWLKFETEPWGRVVVYHDGGGVF